MSFKEKFFPVTAEIKMKPLCPGKGEISPVGSAYDHGIILRHETNKNYLLLRPILLIIKNQLYRLEIKNKENLWDLKELLKHNSVVIYINHLTSVDPLFIMSNLLEEGDFDFQIVAPVSRKHYDFFRKPLSALAFRIGQGLGIKLYPIVQHYDHQSYSEKEDSRLALRFFSQFKKLSQQPGTVFLIAPEGTRNEFGVSLQPAQPGIGLMAKINPEVYFAPVGIVPQEKITSGLNFGRQFALVYGKPFQLDQLEVKDKTRIEIAQDLMTRLANLLPESMRGEYQLLSKIAS